MYKLLDEGEVHIIWLVRELRDYQSGRKANDKARTGHDWQAEVCREGRVEYMIHSTPLKAKFKRLVRKIRNELKSDTSLAVSIETIVIGILESLWHITISSAPQGDIGKLSNEDIAEGVGWQLDADILIEMLVDTMWIDQSDKHRLLIHDWSDHCPNFIKGGLAKQKKSIILVTPRATTPELQPQSYNSRATTPELQPENGVHEESETSPQLQPQGSKLKVDPLAGTTNHGPLSMDPPNITEHNKTRYNKTNKDCDIFFNCSNIEPKDSKLSENIEKQKPGRSKKLKKLIQEDLAVLALFEKFWGPYPKRDGKKLLKQAAIKKFISLEPFDQELAVVASQHFSESKGVLNGFGIKDAVRFLRTVDGDEPWRDWIAPEVLSDGDGFKDNLIADNKKAVQDAIVLIQKQQEIEEVCHD